MGRSRRTEEDPAARSGRHHHRLCGRGSCPQRGHPRCGTRHPGHRWTDCADGTDHAARPSARPQTLRQADGRADGGQRWYRRRRRPGRWLAGRELGFPLGVLDHGRRLCDRHPRGAGRCPRITLGGAHTHGLGGRVLLGAGAGAGAGRALLLVQRGGQAGRCQLAVGGGSHPGRHRRLRGVLEGRGAC